MTHRVIFRLGGSEPGDGGFRTTPVGVSHSVSETDEAVLVLNHQVARVEVHVSLGKHVSHQLLLGQTFAASVAKKRADGADLGQQKARLTCG